jgi:hypothetical protein
VRLAEVRLALGHWACIRLRNCIAGLSECYHPVDWPGLCGETKSKGRGLTPIDTDRGTDEGGLTTDLHGGTRIKDSSSF